MRFETSGGPTTDALQPVRDDPPAVAMAQITKRFRHVVANDGIDFDVRQGEIHALLGENGAGKTTLMNILSGYLQPDSGTIDIRGARAHIRSPHDAIGYGVGMVHQHSALVPTLTVAENMLLGQKGPFVIRKQDLERVSSELTSLAAQHGLSVSPSAFVWQLSVGERQRAEILRALIRDASILVLDEPTASLTPTEVDPLLEKLRGMAAAGSAVVIITHHLDEVMAAADRITVLRGGKRVGTLHPQNTSTRELARLMVGRDVELASIATGKARVVHEGDAPGRPALAGAVLSVRDVATEGDRGVRALHEMSFDIAAGEILAIAGVEGNGQLELEEVLLGLRPAVTGEVSLEGRPITTLNPYQRLGAGVGFIPSDRFRRGLVPTLSVAGNLVIDRIDRPPFGTRFRISPRAILSRARELMQRFAIRAASPGQAAGALSGGNSQRVVLARALSGSLRVLVAAQPSRGLDVAATKSIWEQLASQRDHGVAVLLISTDLDEVFALADRCWVMYRGRLVGPWGRDQFDREQLGLALGGAFRSEPGATEESG
jgi:general nucleoside transport system ATP-binding protein